MKQDAVSFLFTVPYPHYYSDKWPKSLSTPQVAQVQGVYQPPPTATGTKLFVCLIWSPFCPNGLLKQPQPEHSALTRAWLHPLCSSLQVFRGTDGIPLSLLISRLSSPSSQPLLGGEVLQSLCHPGPPLDSPVCPGLSCTGVTTFPTVPVP